MVCKIVYYVTLNSDTKCTHVRHLPSGGVRAFPGISCKQTKLTTKCRITADVVTFCCLYVCFLCACIVVGVVVIEVMLIVALVVVVQY